VRCTRNPNQLKLGATFSRINWLSGVDVKNTRMTLMLSHGVVFELEELCSFQLVGYVASNDRLAVKDLLCNLILFAICTRTFSKLFKQRIQWHVEECSVVLLCE
jgi:hypothetical protein